MHGGQIIKILLSELRQLDSIEKVIIHSFECSIYRACVIIDGQTRMIYERPGKPLSRRSNAALTQLLSAEVNSKAFSLQHQSAYDEMIGQPIRTVSNQLEVPLSPSTDQLT